MSSPDAPKPSASAVAKRAAPGSLMAPPPAPKRIKRPAIVLDEETYTSALAHIIRRDFFPGLAETDAQREYLSALESGDKSWIREAGRKLRDVMGDDGAKKVRRQKVGTGGLGRTPMAREGYTPTIHAGAAGGETPSVWGSDTPLPGATPMSEASEHGRDGERKPAVDLSLSLTAFQARYTSEDQESFSRLIDAANAKKFAANAWLRSGNKSASKQRLAQQNLLQSKEDAKATAGEQGMQIAVLEPPRPSQDLDERKAGVSMHKHTPFNTLMFGPDSIESWAPTRAQAAEDASLAPPKQVLHSNTRLPAAEDLPPRPSSPTMSAVRAAISGHPRLAPSEMGDGSETPRVNGYAFVPARPEDDSDEPETDLLQKMGLQASDGPGFKMSELERREKLHWKMVERIGSRKARGEADGPAGLAARRAVDTPRFLSAPTPRLGGVTPGGAGVGVGGKKQGGNLTPAAQRLFAKVGGQTPRETGAGGFGAKGRDWTPTPKVRRRA